MASSDPWIGRQVGDYCIVGLINSGSFGSVYKGKHLIFEDDPFVAIKLPRAVFHTEEERAEFIREAKLQRQLRHPHILPILTAGFQDGIPFLVTEYASGGSLRDRQNKRRDQPMPIDEAIVVLMQIGEALQYAHQHQPPVVHRDLKPDNILFDEKGNVLLADFGIAVLLSSVRTGLVGRGGTLPYMAPEQFQGLASTKSDQYALGCIAYELLTGHRLFEVSNPTLEAYWYHHTKVEPIHPTHYNQQLPVHIECAILTALAKERENRHEDVLVFCNALLKSQEQWLEEGDYFHDWVYQGEVLYNLERYEEALAAYEQAIRLDPNDANAYMGKGFTLSTLNHYEEALVAYEQSIRLASNFVAYNFKGHVLSGLERYEEALVTYEQAIRLEPNYADSYSGKGKVLVGLERYEEALVAYEQATRLDPNDASAYMGKGFTLSTLNHYEEALVAYEQAIRLDPNHAYVYNGKGDVLSNLKRYKEALEAYEQAIRLDPNFAGSYNGKGTALVGLKRYEEALAAYEQAIRLDPNHAYAYYGKSVVLYNLKRYEETQQAYEKALQLWL